MKSGFKVSLKVTEQTLFVKLTNSIINQQNLKGMKNLDLGTYTTNVAAEETITQASPWCVACAACGACGPTPSLAAAASFAVFA